MCDTQVVISPQGLWFAKNSDREPSEPQVVVRLPAVYGDSSATVQCSHVEIPQVANRHAVILSKPHWMWGAEIGANDTGVVIGNEAIFSRLRTLEPGLLGMDLLRLGLERGATARQALDVITRHLEQYGQGGIAGYRDRGFHYDNSFIIADAVEAWVLETAGRVWVAKRVQTAHAISNRLTLGSDYDLQADRLEAVAHELGHRHGPVNFAATFDTATLPYFAGAARRQAFAEQCIAAADPQTLSLGAMTARLRSHIAHNTDPMQGSNGDLCMHAAGPVRRSQTCGSMVSQLSPRGHHHLLTGTSAPCLSLFRPVAFDDFDYSVLDAADADAQQSLWWRHEPLHRQALFDADFRQALRSSRDHAEAQILSLIQDDERQSADQLARDWEQEMHRRYAGRSRKRAVSRAGLWWRYLDHRDGL